MAQQALNWDESKHPRDELGEFATVATSTGHKPSWTQKNPLGDGDIPYFVKNDSPSLPEGHKAIASEIVHAKKSSRDRSTTPFRVTVAENQNGERYTHAEEGHELSGGFDGVHVQFRKTSDGVMDSLPKVAAKSKEMWAKHKAPPSNSPSLFEAAPAVLRQESGMTVTPPPAPPPRQSLMFDDNPTKSLFGGTVFEPVSKKKPVAKPAAGPSLLEKIEDELAKVAAESKPLGGQREMFARRFDQEIERYHRSSAMRNAIESAASATDLYPSPEQKDAGNYRKGKFNWHGLIIAIENPRGSIRRGKSKAGTCWQVEMKSHYGYILRNISEADGDHVDVYIGPHPESDLVCVIDQRRDSGRFDEHKVMIGFTSIRDAKRAYLSHYASGWNGMESITAMTVPQFKSWLLHGDTGSRISGQVARYKREIDEANGHWVTMHGAHVFISGEGTHRPPKPGSLKPNPWTTPTPETVAAKKKPLPRITFKEWAGEDVPDLSWKDIPIPDDIEFKEWSDEVEPPEAAPPPPKRSRKAAIMEAAVNAAAAAEIPTEHVLPLMPDAHKFLKQEQADREKAKAWLRRVSGLHAGSLARLENKYLDHSTVKNWDSTAREFAINFPDLGIDPEGDDAPARVWDFLREGKAPYIPAYDPKVAELAAQWAAPTMRATERLPGDEEESHRQIDAARNPAEVVPFSRRQLALAEKFSRMFDRARRYSASWDESKHPRGQPENAGEFAVANRSSKKTPAGKTIFHGTFTEFEQPEIGSYWASDKNAAKVYVGDKNGFIHEGRISSEARLKDFGQANWNDPDVKQFLESTGRESLNYQHIVNLFESRDFRAFLLEKGYDGFRLEEDSSNAGDANSVFHESIVPLRDGIVTWVKRHDITKQTRGKEPYMMTQAEFLKKNRGKIASGDATEGGIINKHFASVAKAIREGADVHAGVLKDYPSLAK